MLTLKSKKFPAAVASTAVVKTLKLELSHITPFLVGERRNDLLAASNPIYPGTLATAGAALPQCRAIFCSSIMVLYRINNGPAIARAH